VIDDVRQRELAFADRACLTLQPPRGRVRASFSCANAHPGRSDQYIEITVRIPRALAAGRYRLVLHFRLGGPHGARRTAAAPVRVLPAVTAAAAAAA
jgi:hypothetical protein